MGQSAENSPHRGRPVQSVQVVHQKIVDATLVLLEQGNINKVSIEGVAREAGVAKKTIYRLFANRDELILSVLSSWVDAFEPAFEQDACDRKTLQQILTNGLKQIAMQVLNDRAVALFRVLQTQFVGRDNLLKLYSQQGIERGRAVLSRWLQRQYQLGYIIEADFATMSNLLLACVIAEPLREKALGQELTLDMDSRINASVDIYLHYLCS